MTEFHFAAAWAWCMRCERVHPAVEWVNGEWQCPNPACDGGADDMWQWTPDSILRQEHPEYPEIPERGEHYPL